jgi:hypothetical protein
MTDRSWPEQFTDADLQEHLQTYRGFVRGIKWTIAIAAAVLVLLAFWAG